MKYYAAIKTVIYEDIKIYEWTLNAYGQLKAANLRILHTSQSYTYIVGKAKTIGMKNIVDWQAFGQRRKDWLGRAVYRN